jgi:hypothetical protein
LRFATSPRDSCTLLNIKQAIRSSIWREIYTVVAANESDFVTISWVISEHTVGNHFRAIYARLGISKRSQLTTLLK